MRCLTRWSILWGMAGALACIVAGSTWAADTELLIGAATTSITPDQPIALDGQFHTRVSKGVDNPITATAVAIEARQDGRSVDQAVLVSCDLVAIRPPLLAAARQRLAQKLPEVDARKVILTATHTHTSGVTEEGKYEIPQEGVMQPSQYVTFLVDRLEELIGNAWKQRRPGGVSWGLGHAVVGYNRRAVYANGTAAMYGKTDGADFRGIEGYEDHGLELLLLLERRPAAAAGRGRQRGLPFAGGRIRLQDQRRLLARCPPAIPDRGPSRTSSCWAGRPPPATSRRTGCTAKRPRSGCSNSAGCRTRRRSPGGSSARSTMSARWSATTCARDVPFAHKVEDVALPVRKVTEQEAAAAQAEIDALTKKGDASRRRLWHQKVVDRYRAQDKEPTLSVEVHALRIGDVAIVTNPFELFLDYGVQMQGRSKALQTFVLQLTCGSSGYLPTERAVKGGSYSAVVASNLVGPEGGQVLVDRSVELINSLW